MESRYDRIEHDLYGNGQPGLVEQLRSYLAVQDEKDKIAERQEAEVQWKMPALIAVLAIVIPILYDFVKVKMGIHF